MRYIIGNFNKIIFFTFLSICLSTYTMENNEIDIDKKLLKAINNIHKKEKGNWKKIEKYFMQEADPNIPIGENKITPIILAVNNQQKGLCDCLLTLNANINGCDTYGKTALHSLISHFLSNPSTKNNTNAINIEYLLEHRANANLPDLWGNYPLSTAVRLNRLDFIKPLLQYGAKINLPFSTYSLLGWSIKNQNADIFEELYKHGASLYNVDNDGNTAFHFMISKGALPEDIQKLITYPRFISYKQQEIQEINNSLITILLLFKKLNESGRMIPKELQLRILSRLPIGYFYAHENLYKMLANKGYQLLFPEVYKHIKYLKEILKTKNINNEKTLDLLNMHPDEYIVRVKPLLDVHHLKKELKNLIEKKEETSENNLALQIYNNYNKLLLKLN